MTISMNPRLVSQAGDDLHDIAGNAKGRIVDLLHSSDSAAAGNSGWSSAQALLAVRNAWEQQANSLIDRTTNAAQALKDSAGLVATSDAEAEARMQRLLRDLAAGQ
jgi:hypothetical protein